MEAEKKQNVCLGVGREEVISRSNDVEISVENLTSTKNLIVEYNGMRDPILSGNCSTGWVQLGSKCFLIVREMKTWQQAENSCVKLDGHLARIETQEENQQLAHLLTER